MNRNTNMTSRSRPVFNSQRRARDLGSKIFAAVAVLSMTVGCLSDEEKEARRAWAYDLSGEYEEARGDGLEAGSVEISNETSKNDIVVTFTRGALYAGEETYLDLVIDEDVRAALLSEIVLGEGESPVQEDLTGGENISDNFGESSQLLVASEEVDVTPLLEGASDAKIHYSISAEIVNASDELRGTLTLHYQDRRPSSDPEAENETELHTEREDFNLLLKRVAGPIEGEVCDDCTTGPSEGDEADAADENVDGEA